MSEAPARSDSDAVTSHRRRLVKLLLVFLVLMTGPILCSIFYLTW